MSSIGIDSSSSNGGQHSPGLDDSPILHLDDDPNDPVREFCVPDSDGKKKGPRATRSRLSFGDASGAAGESNSAASSSAAAVEEAKTAAAGGGGGASKRRHSYMTPGGAKGGAGKGNGKRRRSSFAASNDDGLSTGETTRYTYSVMKSKGWELVVNSKGGRAAAASHSSRREEEEDDDDGTGVEYELVLYDTSDDVDDAAAKKPLERHAFATEAEALAYARGKGNIVSAEELHQHAQHCPYKPVIDAMESARSRLGQAGSGDSFVESVRAAEGQRLVGFYTHYLLRPEGGWMRVGGLPGTGKTIAVQHSEELLQRSLEARGVTAMPTFVKVNAAACSNPRLLLETLCSHLALGPTTNLTQNEMWDKLEERLCNKRWKQVSSAHPSWSSLTTPAGVMSALGSPLKAMMSAISRNGGGAGASAAEVDLDKASEVVDRSVVLVLDEVDQFLGSKEASDCLQRLITGLVLNKGSRLLLVTISNTIDDHTTLGALWAKCRGGRESSGSEDSEGGGASASPCSDGQPIVFKSFNHDQLKQILRASVVDTVHDRALDLIVKRVESSRGDARVAIDFCRRALEHHIKGLDAQARQWCMADDPQPVLQEKDRQVLIPEANAASRDLDLDLGKDIEKIPQQARLLLVVTLHLTASGHKIRTSDLQGEFTRYAKQLIGAHQHGASATFDQQLDWLDDQGLIERQQRGMNKFVAPKVGWAVVMPKLTTKDKMLFKALLPK